MPDMRTCYGARKLSWAFVSDSGFEVCTRDSCRFVALKCSVACREALR